MGNSSSDAANKVFAGRFEYLKPLGKGAGGSVYLSEDLHNERRQVALKVLSAEACESVQGKMLRREFEILSKLDHPHLVRVYDYGGLPDGGIYLAEEYIDGFSLQDARALLDPRALIDITRQVLLGLSYLHGMGMIHRDVKPANVMLLWLDDAAARPMVKLVDFGLSSMDPTRDTLRGGTRSYMAPEIIRGNKGELRSDLFSLGVTLYYALCGVLPFGPRSKEDPPPTEEDIHPPAPHRYNREVPLTLSRFTMVLLRQVEGVEYEDAGEALQALSRDTETPEWRSGGAVANSMDVAAVPVIRGYFERGILGRRESEQEELVELLDGPKSDDRGTLYQVEGSSEVGKSRLIREVAASMKLKRCQVISVSCDERMRPWELIHELLHRIVELGVSREIRQIEYYGPYLLILERLSRMQAGSISQVNTAVDFEWLRKAFHDAVVTLHPEPLILFVEGLHRADIASRQFLEEWYDGETELEVPDMLATTVEEESMAPFPDGSRVSHFPVQGVTRKDVERFFTGRLGLQEVDPRWLDEVHRASGGQPAYLEELSRSLVDAGLMWRESVDEWALDHRGLADFDIPQGLRASLRRRFAGVGASGREVLEVLTLYGRPVAWERLRDFVVTGERSDREADRKLQALRRRYLAKMNLEVSGRYMELLDDVLGEVVGEMMSDNWERALHRRIGQQLGEDWRRGRADAAEAARHLEAGGVDGEAAQLYEAAADEAWRASEFGTAHDLYRSALRVCGSGPTRAYLQVKQARVLATLYEPTACHRVLQDAGEAAERTALDWLMNTVFVTAAQLCLTLGDNAGVDVWLERLEDTLPSMSQQVPVLEIEARASINRGDLSGAASTLRRALKRTEHFGQRGGSVSVLGSLADVEDWMGETDRATDHFEEALEMARELPGRQQLGALLCRYGSALRRRGELRYAETLLDEGLEILSHGHRPDLWIEALLQIALCKRGLGDLKTANRYATDAVVFARELGDEVLQHRVEFARAELDFDENRRETAIRTMEKAIRRVQEMESGIPHLLEILIRYARRIQYLDSARGEELLNGAAKLAERIGAGSLAAEIEQSELYGDPSNSQF